MNITIPFVYSIRFTHPTTGQKRWYIGVKYGQGSKPSDLWTSYFTSSKPVWSLLEAHGPMSFTTKIVKMFDDELSARIYEELLVKRAIKRGFRLGIELINKGLPNRNWASNMRGKTFEELFDPITCERLKSILRHPKNPESMKKMKETRRKMAPTTQALIMLWLKHSSLFPLMGKYSLFVVS